MNRAAPADFDRLADLLKPVDGLSVPWCVAGGWAIDLWVETATRSHHDVDLLVARDDQRAVYDHFSDRDMVKVIPHPEGLVGKGTLVTWNGGRIELPVHQVFADAANGDRIEVLFGEIENGVWRYRRNLEVSLSLDRLIVTGPTGIPALAPEVVMLFKAPLQRPWDEADFVTVAPLLPDDRQAWLVDAIERSHPDNPWIERLT
ncbi:MAG: amino acid transporter [Acidimicrobiia bacterium]